ncbi:Iron-sulfur assembly protein 1 [Tulasnella sp. 424]|nr:Iron-sulfur assembly protein 1 [Tulasnella sp. 424]KAG8972152.1 Iron-sulfur assembly protein 1 [Tulasnella sp. 425]
MKPLSQRTPAISPNETSVAGPKPPPPVTPRKAPTLKASKAAITLTPGAVVRLKGLLSGPTPQLIRIGVKNKGCAGMSYHLEYVEKPGKFDEVVEQDGVKVLIDSKALFSIIGSEMDWKEDRISAKFAFTNPNVTDACGCGESFTLG